MKKLVAAAVTTFLFGCAQSPLPSVSRVEDSPDNVLFRDVSVFDGEGMLRHQDVLVVGGTIEAVAVTGSVEVPPGAQEILGGSERSCPDSWTATHTFSRRVKRTCLRRARRR